MKYYHFIISKYVLVIYIRVNILILMFISFIWKLSLSREAYFLFNWENKIV